MPGSAARVLPNIEPTNNYTLLGNSLIAHNYTVKIEKAEEVVRISGLNMAYFFFETGNGREPVMMLSVGNICRSSWLYRTGRWSADSRILIKNLDASKLNA